MEMLSNKRVAAGIMVLMILLGIVLGAYRSGSRLYGEVEDLFYNGQTGNGIGVASDLSDRAEAAFNLIVVAKRNMDQTDPAILELEKAAMAANSAGTLQGKGIADQMLEVCMDALYEALGEVALSEKDAGYRESLYADFNSAAMTMSHDPYNAQAVEYNRAIRSLPGRFFFSLFGFEEAPVFR